MDLKIQKFNNQAFFSKFSKSSVQYDHEIEYIVKVNA